MEFIGSCIKIFEDIFKKSSKPKTLQTPISKHLQSLLFNMAEGDDIQESTIIQYCQTNEISIPTELIKKIKQLKKKVLKTNIDLSQIQLDPKYNQQYFKRLLLYKTKKLEFKSDSNSSGEEYSLGGQQAKDKGGQVVVLGISGGSTGDQKEHGGRTGQGKQGQVEAFIRQGDALKGQAGDQGGQVGKGLAFIEPKIDHDQKLNNYLKLLISQQKNQTQDSFKKFCQQNSIESTEQRLKKFKKMNQILTSLKKDQVLFPTDQKQLLIELRIQEQNILKKE